MAEHDQSYKSFFSNPSMIRDLLTGFIHEDWVTELDLTTLETVKSSFVTDDLRDREDDIIWRVRWSDEWVYIYLLIEFQSSVDKFMAVRIMNYVSLLYQDLIKQKQLAPDQKLPPVFPVVLYNGEARWSAAQDVKELVYDLRGGLSRYCPSMYYTVLDEGKLIAEQHHPPAFKNLVNALFQMEFSTSPRTLADSLKHATEWLEQEPKLKRVFLIWLKRVLLPNKFPGVELDEINDLHEVQSMLAERVKNWTQEWKEQGLAEGRQEGREKGLQEGLQEGRQEGRQEGLQEGRKKVALNLINQTTMDDASIAAVAELTVEEVQALRVS